MKFLFGVFFLVFSFAFIRVDMTDDIISAVRQGKAAELIKFFDDKIFIKIIEQEDVLSKSQAEANLKYFFEKHPVKNFSSVRINNVNTSSQYLNGNLETANGKFRVSALLRRGVVSQFRIEVDND